MATTIDAYSRFWCPLLYAMAMGMTFGIELDDAYRGRDGDGAYVQQQPLLSAMRVKGTASISVLIGVPLAVLTLAVLPAAFVDGLLLPAWRRRQGLRARREGLALVKAYSERTRQKTIVLPTGALGRGGGGGGALGVVPPAQVMPHGRGGDCDDEGDEETGGALPPTPATIREKNLQLQQQQQQQQQQGEHAVEEAELTPVVPVESA
jgi:hypothetical protein